MLQICSLGILLVSVSITTANASAVIPKPGGQYGVGVSTMKLTDRTRIDPFAPHRAYRNVMISVFQPSASAKQCNTVQVNYMQPATAAIVDQYYHQDGLPNGTFERLQLSLCKGNAQKAARIQDFPVALFSPGLGNSRLLYSALAQSVASFGNVVVSIDHPYDANVVEYPDGTLVLGANISTEAQIDLARQDESTGCQLRS